MGNCCTVEGAVDHWIYVKVGDRKQPLTDAKLRVIVQDITGKQSHTIKLDYVAKNEFERGAQEAFEVRVPRGGARLPGRSPFSHFSHPNPNPKSYPNLTGHIQE